MQVVADTTDGRYLLSVDEDVDAALDSAEARGRVLLTEGKVVLKPAFGLQAILSRGGWRDCRMSKEETDALLARYGFPPANVPGKPLAPGNLTPPFATG